MSMKAVYQILRAIHTSYENNDFNFNKTLSLEKLNISERLRILIIENLYKSGYVEGLSVSFGVDGDTTVNISCPRLTLSGLEYLENNSSMKQAYKALKEAGSWIPGIG